MVNVVDVEITLDNFKRAFGRTPSQEEIAMMMKLKALKQEKQINTGNTGNTMERSRKSQKAALELGRKKKLQKKQVKVTPRAMTINKMLNYGLTEDQVADVLNEDVMAVRNCMYRFRLPREDCIIDDKFMKHSELLG